MMRVTLLRNVIWAVPSAALHRSISVPLVHRRAFSVSAGVDQGLPSLELVAASPLATQLVAHYFASSFQPGDAYLLFGEVGAGKSYFSRAFIRAALRDPNAPVPSPTFLLQNIYPTGDAPDAPNLHHFDLYRLTQPQDLSRLDLERSLPTAVSLIEWAERLGSLTPQEHLAVNVTIISQEERAALRDKGIGPGTNAINAESGNGLEDKEQEEEEEDYEEEDGNDDLRWRSLKLIPRGERWLKKVEDLERHVRARGAELDLYLVRPLTGSP